jgi:hypothetical protein
MRSSGLQNLDLGASLNCTDILQTPPAVREGDQRTGGGNYLKETKKETYGHGPQRGVGHQDELVH